MVLVPLLALLAGWYVVVWTAPYAVPNLKIKVVEGSGRDALVSGLAEAVKEGRPLLVRNGVSHWPAFKKWKDLAYLEDTVGKNEPVVLQTGVQEQRNIPFVETTFHAFVEWLKGHPGLEDVREYQQLTGLLYYIAEEFDFLERKPKLYEDLNNLTDFDQLSKNMVGGNKFGNFETAFWMGGAGARTGWHYDYDYSFNVLCHLKGEKRVYLASPTESKHLYPSTDRFDPGAILSSVNFWEPDNSTYPLYRNIQVEEVNVRPGDAFFIPAGYWHAVESLSTSISVSVRMMPKYLWAINGVDRLLETLHYLNLYNPKKGSVEKGERVKVREL